MRNEVGWIELVRIQRAIKGDSKLRLFTVVLSLDQFCLDLWVVCDGKAQTSPRQVEASGIVRSYQETMDAFVWFGGVRS